MRFKLYLLMVIFAMNFIFSQKRDPRTVALAGATTTVADGIYAVGYNPALIAYQKDKPFMLQLGGIDLGMKNNYLSIATLNALNGDTLENDEKSYILNRLERNGGLRLDLDGHLAIPFLNFSSGNMVLSSNMNYLSTYSLPAGLVRLILEGNANNPNIDMTFGLEIMGVNEFGFSFAVPFDSYAVGLTVKYLQGLFYMGLDPDSSKADLITTPQAVYGSGKYYLRQGFGGSGYGIDIGLVTKEFNRMRFGVSIINASASIGWNKPSLLKDALKEYPLKWGGERLSDSVAVLYTYSIDSLRADNLSSGKLFTSSSAIVKNLDENGKVKKFNISYPTIFRIGGSYRGDEVLISSDLSTGFENRFFSTAQWKWAIGAELYRFDNLPLRLGFSWEGMDRTEFGMGAGFHGGPVMIDVGFSFKSGMWVHTMKGLNFSLGFTMTSFKGRDSKNKKSPEEGPSPLPEESLPDQKQEQKTSN